MPIYYIKLIYSTQQAFRSKRNEKIFHLKLKQDFTSVDIFIQKQSQKRDEDVIKSQIIFCSLR